MLIKFKNSNKKFAIAALSESKVFDSTQKEVGWLLITNIIGEPDISTETIDNLLSGDSISEIIVYTDEEDESLTIAGYQKVNLTIIKYEAGLPVSVDIQLTKRGGHIGEQST